jgi:S-formylglutathione hydrolase
MNREYMEIRSSNKSFGGEQRVYSHVSRSLSCEMKFAAFNPPGKGPFPALFWLSGLTCTEENFTVKAGAQRIAAELGLVIVAPDTSPRGEGVPDDAQGAYDFGLGAGFYVDATEAPWSQNYRMRSYVEEELFELALAGLPIDKTRIGIFGHSMGGHGALTIALRNPDKFKSVSAFAPIVSPMNCPWGEKALSGYLGADRSKWREYDACALIEDGARVADILVDQGDKDPFLDEQLKPELLEAACKKAGVPLTLRLQPGYDHSYYFISTFIEEHLRWHKKRLAA